VLYYRIHTSNVLRSSLLSAPILFAAILVAVILIAGLFRSLLFSRDTEPFNPTWLDGFSTARYQPMLRLLSESDYEFLSKQSGFTPELGRRWRANRRKIFRGYLRMLVRDFNQLHGAARGLVVHAEGDRSDLALALIGMQLKFVTGIIGVRFRLALHGAGIGNIDVHALINCLGSLRAQIVASKPSNDLCF
jgi:hypothetical protein